MRREFTAKVKLAAFDRSKGVCDACGAKLFTGNIEYDHVIPCGLDIDGGDNSDSNIACVCRNCHRAKTSSIDVPRIAKAKRNYRTTVAGVRKPRTIRAWRKFSGELVRATRER